MTTPEPIATKDTESGPVTMPQSQADAQVSAQHDAMNAAPESAPEAVTQEPAQEVKAEPEPPVNEREAKLEAIAKRRMAEMMPKVEAAPEPAAETEPETDAEPEVKRVKLKVSGEEQEVDETELVKLAQKGLAADKKFNEAATLAKSSEQRIKELEDKLAQLASTSLPSDGTKKPALPTKDDGPMEFTADTIDQAVYAGDETGQKAREELARRLNTQPTDPRQIAAQVRLEMRVEQAVERLSEADPVAKQLLHDEKMSQIVDRYSGMLQDLEPNLSEHENLKRACQQARMHFPELEPPADTTPQMTPSKQVAQTKQAHAAGNVSAPAQRINLQAAPPTPQQAQAAAKAQLRQARGLLS